MRSKEVEEAIKDLKFIVVTDIYGNEVRIENLSVKTLLSYIEELEQLPNKIRDKIKELEEDIEESKRMIKNATDEDEKKWWQEELIKLVTGKLYLEEIIGE